MKLSLFEQSGCMLEMDDGFKLAWDIAGFTPLEKLDKFPRPDLMLVSHIHPDHFSPDHIKKLNPKELYLNEQCRDDFGDHGLKVNLLESNISYDMHPGLEITCFDVDHGPNATQPLLGNYGFLIHADGESVYFAGDMFYPSGLDVSKLEVDYALLPIGEYYTFGPKEAIEFSKQFKSIRNLRPIHYSIKPETKLEFDRLVRTANPARQLRSF